MAGRTFAGIEAFVAVAEARSFRRGAAQLGVSPAAVSKAITGLEARLGVRLLERTSRKVTLTPPGTAYLARCRQALAALQAGQDEVSTLHEAVSGHITLSASHTLGRPITELLPSLTGAHPGLTVELRLTDRFVRLLEEDVDVAVRMGKLEDSGLTQRRLPSPRWATVASPTYLSGRPPVRRPEDLQQGHVLLAFRTPAGGLAPWQFAQRRGATPEPVTLPLRHRFDQGERLVDAALAGMGVAQVFGLMVREHLAAGRLVELLPRRAGEGPPLHALCRPGQARTARIRAVLDLLERLGQAT